MADRGSKRTITDSDTEEAIRPSAKRPKTAQLIENDVTRDVLVATIQHHVKEVAGQVGPRNHFTPSHEPRLTQVLAALPESTAVGDQADIVQPIQITMIGGTGGNGGNGVNGGGGGAGGEGRGPRLIENFFQITIRDSEPDGQVNPGIGRIAEGLGMIWDGIAEYGTSGAYLFERLEQSGLVRGVGFGDDGKKDPSRVCTAPVDIRAGGSAHSCLFPPQQGGRNYPSSLPICFPENLRLNLDCFSSESPFLVWEPKAIATGKSVIISTRESCQRALAS
ncbi:hypothetical protein B0H14DRAFT_3140895 [Mycena olivaceomarginata]|nr:hypothetical protein B0H14DRAFT_3140895 [Mycena olivaceomarginata]